MYCTHIKLKVLTLFQWQELLVRNKTSPCVTSPHPEWVPLVIICLPHIIKTNFIHWTKILLMSQGLSFIDNINDLSKVLIYPPCDLTQEVITHRLCKPYIYINVAAMISSMELFYELGDEYTHTVCAIFITSKAIYPTHRV